MEFTAQQIADFLQGTVDGDPNVKVGDFSKIEEGRAGTLTFLANPKYEHYIYATSASIVLVNNDFVPSATIDATLIRVDNAYAALARLMQLADQARGRKTGVADSACIASSATIGEGCYIGHMAYIGEKAVIGDNCLIHPYAFIGEGVTVGASTVLYPHATVYDNCVIGRNCILHAGAVVGADGFGFAPEGESYKKIPQLGNAVIEDDVEIGANTTIDRAVMGSTLVRKGVKLDNLIQVAHNVEIGEHTVIAAQTGIAGSTRIGRHCRIAGQVGIAGHLHIADEVQIAAQSGIMRDVSEPGSSLFGTPAFPAREQMKTIALAARLPELYGTLNRLQQEVEQLKQTHK